VLHVVPIYVDVICFVGRVDTRQPVEEGRPVLRFNREGECLDTGGTPCRWFLDQKRKSGKWVSMDE